MKGQPLILLMALALGGSAGGVVPGRHWNASRGYEDFRNATPGGIVMRDTTSACMTDGVSTGGGLTGFTLRFMASNRNNHPSRQYSYITPQGMKRKRRHPSWGFYIKGSGHDSLIFEVATVEVADALSSSAALRVTARHSNPVIPPAETDLKDGVDCYTGLNLWQLSLREGRVSLWCGNHSPSEVFTVACGLESISEFGFTATPGADLLVRDITLSDQSPHRKMVQTEWSDQEHLRSHLATSEDELEGYWTVFDRTLEESMLRLGGDYGIAIVRDGAGEYLLIYLTGAQVNSSMWKAGMIKGRLAEDPFPGIYSVEWIDSEGEPLTHSIKAQKGEGHTLSIQFPYHSSTLRLRKLPSGK